MLPTLMTKPAMKTSQSLIDWNTLAIVICAFVPGMYVDKVWPDLSLLSFFFAYTLSMLVVGIPSYIALVAVVKSFRGKTGEDDQTEASDNAEE